MSRIGKKPVTVPDGVTASLDGHLLYPSAKAGLAFDDVSHEAPDGVLRDAQSALARAKASGSDSPVSFTREMRLRQHLNISVIHTLVPLVSTYKRILRLILTSGHLK